VAPWYEVPDSLSKLGSHHDPTISRKDGFCHKANGIGPRLEWSSSVREWSVPTNEQASVSGGRTEWIPPGAWKSRDLMPHRTPARAGEANRRFIRAGVSRPLPRDIRTKIRPNVRRPRLAGGEICHRHRFPIALQYEPPERNELSNDLQPRLYVGPAHEPDPRTRITTIQPPIGKVRTTDR
jgi:hypothetical protein